MKSRQRFWDLGLKKQLLLLGMLGLSFLIGCSTTNTVPSPYLLTGGVWVTALGAGIGAVVNHNNPWKGAGIGALLGAAGGGIAGGIYGQSQTRISRNSRGLISTPAAG